HGLRVPQSQPGQVARCGHSDLYLAHLQIGAFATDHQVARQSEGSACIDGIALERRDDNFLAFKQEGMHLVPATAEPCFPCWLGLLGERLEVQPRTKRATSATQHDGTYGAICRHCPQSVAKLLREGAFDGIAAIRTVEDDLGP